MPKAVKNVLIGEYLACTGRPAASLTVDEFLKFIAFTERYDYGRIIDDTDNGKTKRSSVRTDAVQAPDPVQKPVGSINTVKSDTKTITPPETKQGDILQILKSISG